MARFTLVVATDALIGFATALLLVRLMPTASSLLLGLCVGSVCATMLDGPRMVSALRRGHIQRPILREITRIGAPLSLTFLLSASIMYADRFIVGGFISTKELATYAVAWSLVSQPITLVGSALAIATMPMAMHALDLHGYQAGRTQAGRTGMLIIALIAPAAAGLAMCHEQVATLLTGAEFRATVSTLIPFVAGISFLRAVGSFYLEHAYYLSRRSDLMLYAYIPPAVANIVLNLIAAPIFGIAGVLVTAAICQVMTAAGLVYFARGVFPLLFPWRPLVSVAAASIAMMIAVYMLHADVSWFGLAQQVIVGAAVYGIILFATDAFEVRTRCSEMIRGRRFFSSANPGE
jgi:O-antigen/teichoic acid export membrane protein